MNNTILITGCAGFIGWKVSECLLLKGEKVIGIDNMNHFYDPRLKEWRLKKLKKFPDFLFHFADISNLDFLKGIFKDHQFASVINLAARAGVRASLEDPWAYLETNLKGTLNLLECCKEFGVKKFVLASTSSIYGLGKLPFREEVSNSKTLTPYSATKKGAEVLGYSYHYLYGIDITILRYFTVYGPAGRPDMSIFRFIKHIAEEKPIQVFGDGRQKRDFTYIDDIAWGTIEGLKEIGYEIINLGNHIPVELRYVIALIEEGLQKKAKIEFLSRHKADVFATWAEIDKARKVLGWEPKTKIEEGIRNTIDWYLENRDWLKEIRI